MDEYISREAALKKIQMQLLDLEADQDKGEYSELCENRGARDALDEAIYDIRTLKAADVQPVKHGRWLKHHAIWIDQPKIEGWFVQAKCSECEKWAHVMNPYTKSVDYECCPHCGARMLED